MDYTAGYPPTRPTEPPDPSRPPPQVRCEVTGKFVDPEDTVEFQGKVVSAEGKNRLLAHMLGGWDSPTERTLSRPSFWRRLLCSMLDGFLMTIIIVVVNVGILRTRQTDGFSVYYSTRELYATLFSYALPFLYYAYMHYKYGRSLGKMAGGYRVVNMADGLPISARTSFVRAFWSNGLSLFFLGGAMLFFRTPGVLAALNVIIAIYGVVNYISLPMDQEYNRPLHDRFAGTRVVMDE